MKTPNKVQNFLIKGLGIPQYLENLNVLKDTNKTILFSSNENARKQLEYFEWYNGDVHSLEYFYKNRREFHMYDSNAFWHVVNTNMPKLHYPLPQTSLVVCWQ